MYCYWYHSSVEYILPHKQCPKLNRTLAAFFEFAHKYVSMKFIDQLNVPENEAVLALFKVVRQRNWLGTNGSHVSKDN